MNPSIRIALADDETLFRKGMRILLEDFGGMSVVLEAQHGQDLLDQLADGGELPDILLLDLNMPELNGVETAKILQRDYPDLRIIILSTYFSKKFILNMIELGAASYLPKNSLPDEVEQTIREVHDKGFAYNDAVMAVIRENMIRKTRPKATFGPDLSEREQEVLQLICEQFTTGEIAEKLFISARTVDGHRNNLLQKLGCRNTAGLVVYALQHQLVHIPPEAFWGQS
ncbi:MAG: DNA-binding response regulator [Bacteroidetes bacterium]|nr:MAG: DNA-binding response regulator [Bacteroidota bacterium]